MADVDGHHAPARARHRAGPGALARSRGSRAPAPRSWAATRWVSRGPPRPSSRSSSPSRSCLPRPLFDLLKSRGDSAARRTSRFSPSASWWPSSRRWWSSGRSCATWAPQLHGLRLVPHRGRRSPAPRRTHWPAFVSQRPGPGWTGSDSTLDELHTAGRGRGAARHRRGGAGTDPGRGSRGRRLGSLRWADSGSAFCCARRPASAPSC